MSFADQLQRFAKQTEKDETAIFVATVVELRDGIKFGSALTGAPALPVAPSQFPRAGALRDSVTESYPDPHTALIYTTSPYAVDVEDNAKGHQFANGGAHGWKMAVAAFERVLSTVTARITGYGR